MEIRIKRIYEPAAPDDGIRVLVDRLWPRGISREAAKVDCWARALAPSHELRKWYGHDPARWEEFKKRYFAELDGNAGEVRSLREGGRGGRATFLYSSTERLLNNAQALKVYLELRTGDKEEPDAGERIGTVFDYHRDRRPEAVAATTLADLLPGEGERSYDNLWFFTRC